MRRKAGGGRRETNGDSGAGAPLDVRRAEPGEEEIVLDVLEQAGILVHPGYFFDFEREAFLILSLLPESRVFLPAAGAVFEQIGARR